MTETAQSIKLNLTEKLKNSAYRRKFFLAESSALIAEQLIRLRKRRGMNQHDLATRIGTKQPAICRIEQADYRSWSFKTLLKIADELDARLRVVIVPYEDVIMEYGDSFVSNKTEPSGTYTILTTPNLTTPNFRRNVVNTSNTPSNSATINYKREFNVERL